MAVFSSAFHVGGPIMQTGPLFDVRSGPTDYARFLEALIIVSAGSSANSVSWGLGLNATPGSARQSGIVFNPDDGISDPGLLAIGIDWTVPPTLPTSYFRRISQTFSGTQEQTIYFRSAKGIVLQPSSSLGLWIVATNSVASAPLTGADAHVVIDV